MVPWKAEIKKQFNRETNWAVSVYDQKLYFCKNSQTLTYSVIMLIFPVILVKWISTILNYRSPSGWSAESLLQIFSPVLWVEPVGEVFDISQ